MSKQKPSFEPWLCSWPQLTGQNQGFPWRFWGKWCKTYRRDPMLHLFCGASTEGHTRVDIRPESVGANVLGSYEDLESDGSLFASSFADPPYTDQHAAEWGYPYPKPSSILKVMRDLTETDGVVGVLHLQVLRPVKGLTAIAYHPVFCGTTKHLRCLSVFRKENPS